MEENLDDSAHLKELFLKIYTLRKVVIAQIQGAALAGGCGLVTVCDYSVASSTAKFGYTEVKIGFVPALVATFLIRRIGEGRAKQLLLTGDVATANEALQLGLINRVVEPAELEGEVMRMAQHLIRTNSQKSMELTKQLIPEVQDLSLEEALNLAARVNAEARTTEDCKKGLAAFLSKTHVSW